MLSVGVGKENKTEEELSKCGFYYCIEESNGNSTDEGIPDWKKYTMASVYLIFALVSSAIVVAFVDPLNRYSTDIDGSLRYTMHIIFLGL